MHDERWTSAVGPQNIGVPRRLDFVRFRVGDDELEAAFQVARELAERARRAPDEAARSAAAKIHRRWRFPADQALHGGAGVPRSSDRRIVREAASVCRLRKRLPQSLPAG